MNHNDLINTTITSGRENIDGFYFYKNGWRVVLKSTCVYASFNINLGCFWTKLHHKIIASKKVSSKRSEWLQNCSDKEFYQVKV